MAVIIDGKTYRNLEEQVQKNTYDVNHITNESIKSGDAASGTVLTADGEGGASWAAGGSGGMANPMTAEGDLILGGSGGTPTRLSKGSNGQVLKMASGVPQWGADALDNIDEVNAPYGTPTVLYDEEDGINITGTAQITDKASGTHNLNIDIEIPIQPGDGITIDADEDAEHIVISSNFVNPMTAEGDLILGGASGTPTRLSKGSNGQVLKVASGVPQWGAEKSYSAGDGITISGNEIAVKVGDGIFFNANDEVALNTATKTKLQEIDDKSEVSGTDDGSNWTSITIDGTTKAIPSGGGGGMVNPMTAEGDLILGGSGGTPTRLSKGSNGQVLKMASGVPQWASGLVDPTTTNGDLIYKGGGALQRLPKGSANQVLTMAPDGSLPIWATPSGGSETIYEYIVKVSKTSEGQKGAAWFRVYSKTNIETVNLSNLFFDVLDSQRKDSPCSGFFSDGTNHIHTYGAYVITNSAVFIVGINESGTASNFMASTNDYTISVEKQTI